MAFIAQHFAYEAPRFGRSKAEKELQPFKNSPYYLWWEFLRRNKNYELICRSDKKGEFESLFNDFGDVHLVDFKTWWQTNDRGRILFAEKLPPKFQILDDFKVERLDKCLYLQVPLSLPATYLRKEFNKLMVKYHSGSKGKKHNEQSTAKYPITGHIDTIALQKALSVYDLRVTRPDLSWWEIAQISKVTSSSQFVKNDGTETAPELTAKKYVLANTAIRLYKRAQHIITGTGHGRFPELIKKIPKKTSVKNPSGVQKVLLISGSK